MVRILWSLLAVVSFATAALGQTPAAPAPPPTTPAAQSPEPVSPPEAIAVPEVMGRATETEDELRKIAAIAEPDPVVASIAAELPKTREALDANVKDLRDRLSAAGQIRNLGDLENRWLLERGGLESWDQTLTARAHRIEDRVDRLNELAKIWQRTRADMIAADAPPAVLQRIDTTTALLESTRAKVDARRADVLEIQGDIAALVDVVNGVLDRIASERGEVASRLLGSDAPPLWSLLGQGRMDAPTRERELRELERDIQISREYAAKRIERIAIHAVAIGVLAMLLTLAKRRAARHPGREDRTSVEIIDRPISCAILFGLIGSVFVYGASPSMFRSVVGLLGLIPLLRLMPPLIPESAEATFRALAFVFFVECLRTLIVPAVTLERLLFVAELCFSLFVLVRLLRPARLALVRPDERFFPFAGTGIRLVAGALFVAVVANVLGSTEFSVLLGEGILRSVYIGFATFAVFRVAIAMVDLILNGETVSRLNMVRRHRALMLRRAKRVFRVAATVVWLALVLRQFDIREEAWALVANVFTARLEVGELSASLGDVLRFVAVLFAAVGFSRFLRFVLEEDVLPRMRLPRGVPYAITATIHYSIVFVGLIAALAAMGIDLGKFSVLAGALGVGVGFGLQTVVGNFVAGLILLFERPIQTGDVVEVGALLGEVRRIGIRASTVRTFEGAEVIVPNASLISDQVVNWTLSDRQRRVDVKVGVKYGTDPEVVLALLLQVARSDERILAQPEPDAQFLGFGESSLDFQLRAWTAHYSEWLRVRSDLNVAVNRALCDANIEIPFPQRDLHLRSVSDGVGNALKPAPDSDA